MIDCVASPVDHKLPPVEEDVSTTEDPAQIDSVVPVTIVGTGGNELTVTVCGAEVPEEHPFEITCTRKVPELLTVMDCVVAPLDQKLLLGDEDVNVTDPPAQNVVEPLAVIVGTAGIVLTITFTGADAADVHPNWV
ncbi:hypothetical protein D3C86_1498320 [compost metagenome]